MNTKESYIKIEDDYQSTKLEHVCVPKHYEEDLEKVMIPWGFIQDRIERLARDIFQSVRDQPLTVICVLKGGYRFFSDLIDKLMALNRSHNKRSVPLNVDFIRLKSYENESSTGEVKVVGGDSLKDLEGRNVLVVEDLIETGRTIQKLMDILLQHKPASVRVAALFVKRIKDIGVQYRPDHCGFEIPDEFIVGYAMDYNEYFRDLNHICVINKNGKEKYTVKE